MALGTVAELSSGIAFGRRRRLTWLPDGRVPAPERPCGSRICWPRPGSGCSTPRPA
ncbi:hypothetical protein HBB16_21035 [Pseudonocardia sp. MCCB 268]|nr:hypothetical protein [Pseudonocardia cytotoxica]